MSVTASRLGHSPLTLDWTHLGNATTSDRETFVAAWSKVKARFDAGEVGFYRSPTDNELSQAVECQALALEIQKQDLFTDCLFLGIGGSALGPISLLGALQDRCTSRLRFHFMENPDPTDWQSTISTLNPATTLVVAVTKSGGTFETIAQLLLSLEWLGKERWKTHVIAITDPQKGDLKAFAKQEGIRTLHISPAMGGRFSVFTPVGLFPAALAGLSIPDFFKGAQDVREYIDKAPAEKNPLFIVGNELIRQYSKRPIHVCMPYSTRLRSMGDWFVQLWGESLGKDGKGFTPVAAVGATDQHSILQLLRDGPDDKITFFITTDKVSNPVPIPRISRTLPGARYASFAILEGHSLHDLLQIEYRATSMVLTKRGRSHLTLRVDELNERSLGALYFAFSVLTAFTGTLWGINPFDQPGVEEAKIYIREALTQEQAAGNREFDDNSAVARLRRDQL